MKTEDLKLNKNKLQRPRLRIAPSPTGFLHIGTARTALFNYVFAKQKKGIFVLRIEDTDKKRSDPKFEKEILDALKWLGMDWDEGPDKDGKYGPYRQSQRGEVYEKYLEKLLQENKAYYCFCSKDDLDAERQYRMARGEPPRYSGKCGGLSETEIKNNLKQSMSCIIRFRLPAKKIKFQDLIRGEIEFDSSLFGDIAIAKDINTPLYNFAVVIDDFEMKITHVIRGEDHISNTPKQILLQETLGFPRPEYAHLPLILGVDKSKLSKRHGAVSVGDYKKQGYLPEALINFMAFLGWNPGTEREIFSLKSLIKDFSFQGVQKGGAVFNIKRLDFLNGFYIRQKSSEKLTELCLPYLIEAGLLTEIKNNNNSKNKKVLKLKVQKEPQFEIKETGEQIGFWKIEKLVSLYQQRLKKLSEISELTDFFFKDKLEHAPEMLRWKNVSYKDIISVLDRLESLLSKMENRDWNKQTLEKILMPEAERAGDRGKVLWPFRVLLCGKKASAGPFEIADVLGKEKTLLRIKQARELIHKKVAD